MDLNGFMITDEIKWIDDIEDSFRDFPITLRSDKKRTGTDYHHQLGLEIHMTTEGSGTMVVGKQVLLQTPRSVLVFWGSVPHQMITASSYKRKVICVDLHEPYAGTLPKLHRLIDFSWVQQDACLSFSFDPKTFKQIEDLYNLMQQEMDNRKVGWEQMMLTHMLQITVILQRSKASSDAAAPDSHSMVKMSEIVQLCSDYICSNLSEDLSLKTVSKRFAVSGEHLTRTFSKEIGISFYQYVLLQRVAEGKRLLRDTPDVSISDIALIIGFPSSSHFSHHFKALTGETPSSYRQRTLLTK
jgi:AraC-like DNA-binding protein